MESHGTVKGRGKAIQTLLDKMEELGDHVEDYPVYIGHADAPLIAQQIETLVQAKYPKAKISIKVVNPTAGSHCGPDSCGVAFHAKQR